MAGRTSASQSAVDARGGARGPRGPITLRELEMEAIHEALERTGGAKPKAAAELGISLKTLYNKLNQESGLKAA